MTGFTFINPELIGKWMDLLKVMMPGLTGAAVMFNPATTQSYIAGCVRLPPGRRRRNRHHGAACQQRQ